MRNKIVPNCTIKAGEKGACGGQSVPALPAGPGAKRMKQMAILLGLAAAAASLVWWDWAVLEMVQGNKVVFFEPRRWLAALELLLAVNGTITIFYLIERILTKR